ncbi:MAG: Rhs element Vgr protein [Massilia sp.]
MARPLTGGEMAMVRWLFGAAIDTGRVRVHDRRYLPFGLQPKHCAMAPNGHLYFHHSCWRADFAGASPHDQHWFMHEMVHVWQHQLGYPVRLRGALRIGLDYAYRLAPDATLADFNMEAQGDLLADYFVLKFVGKPGAMRQGNYAGSLALFERVLAQFLAHPQERANLPSGIARRLAMRPLW